MKKGGYVYILASKKNGTIYIGVTANLPQRIAQHKANTIPGFSSTYKVQILVYYEFPPPIEQAITAEKRLKAWKRAWKVNLIEQSNPEWLDLPV